MEKARILIVEDEAIIAMEVESQLQGLGYNVTSIVDTGEKAIKKAEEDRPDLILMDIRIKGEMDGIDTAEAIRSQFGIPVIFSTAYLDHDRIDRAKITMPFGYVLKPIQERDLKVTIEMALYVAKVDRERRKVEEELKLEKEKYKIAFQTSPDAVNINRMDGLYVDINEGFTWLTGFSREDVIGKFSSEIQIWAIPEDRERLTSGLKEKGYVENLESKFRCKDGSFKTSLMSARIIELNSEPHILSITRDITDRKKIEEELKESQLIFSQQFYQSSTSMCLYTPDGTIEKANLKFCEMFGVEEQEIVTKKYNMFQDRAMVEGGVIPFLKKLFNEKKSVSWKVNFNITLASQSTGTPTSKEGILNLEIYGYPILDQKGELLHVVLQHHDITSRLQAENEAIEGEIKYRKLFEDSIDGYAVADPETGIISECNQALADLVGKSKEDIVGQHQRVLHPPNEQNGKFSATFKNHVNEKSGETLKAQIITKTGEIKDVNIRARVFEINNKKIMHGVFRLQGT